MTNEQPPIVTEKPVKPRPVKNMWIALMKGIVGAIVGGVVGFYAFDWMRSQGFYALMLPGALLGLGFGLAAQYKSIAFGVLCAIAALVLGMFTEWMFWPFKADNSLLFFFKNFSSLPPVTLLMIGLATAMAFWFGRGR